MCITSAMMNVRLIGTETHSLTIFLLYAMRHTYRHLRAQAQSHNVFCVCDFARFMETEDRRFLVLLLLPSVCKINDEAGLSEKSRRKIMKIHINQNVYTQ